MDETTGRDPLSYFDAEARVSGGLKTHNPREHVARLHVRGWLHATAPGQFQPAEGVTWGACAAAISKAGALEKAGERPEIPSDPTPPAPAYWAWHARYGSALETALHGAHPVYPPPLGKSTKRAVPPPETAPEAPVYKAPAVKSTKRKG